MRTGLAVLLLTASCAATPATPASPAGDTRLAELEARLDALERSWNTNHGEVIQRLDRLEGALAERPAAPAVRRGPDPAAVYAVDVSGAPAFGKADAPVTMVVGMEFWCPYCEKVRPTIEQLRADYGDRLRVVEMAFIVHPQKATLPAQAACAAHLQGKYEPYRNLLWNAFLARTDMDQRELAGYARQLKLDRKRFEADMLGPCVARVQEEQRRLSSLGMTGTPGFFINGRFLSGARPIEQFKVVIDEELARADAALGKDGLTPANYYERVVVQGGRKTP
jgi:protein-disulfide isomerase